MPLSSHICRCWSLRCSGTRTSLVFWLRAVWLGALVYGEVIVFYRDASWNCEWPTGKDWDTSATYHVALFADPQIVDEYSYRWTGILETMVETFADLYIRKLWNIIQRLKRPDASFIVGDLMDGARHWDDNRWNAERDRFRALFANDKPVYYAVGNHDIGFGDDVIMHARQRWTKEFGRANYEVRLGNHTFVVVDTVSLSAENANINGEAWKFVEKIGKRGEPTEPRILMTHVPLYRPLDVDCGPLRQRNGTIPFIRGFQYQTLVGPNRSQFLLQNVKPVLAFSGDDHDYCKVQHKFSGSQREDVTEVTLPAFSFTAGIPRGGYGLLSLYNPGASSSSSATYAETTCLLPNQFNIYIWYIALVYITMIVVLCHAYIRAWRNTRPMLPLQRVKAKAANSILLCGLYWRTVAHDILMVCVFGFCVYLACWIWFI